MTKDPVAGRVKTRLARGIGTVAATATYRAMVTSIAARLGGDRRWQTILAVSPDHAVATRMLPSNVMRVAQGNGDLGARMQRILDDLPPGPVVIVGTDIPTITTHDIAAAFKALGQHDAVFGPSRDGGYWLIGMKRRPRNLRSFDDGVRWSSEHALADTTANLKNASIALLGFQDDIDTAEDLARLRAFVGRRILPRSR